MVRKNIRRDNRIKLPHFGSLTLCTNATTRIKTLQSRRMLPYRPPNTESQTALAKSKIILKRITDILKDDRKVSEIRRFSRFSTEVVHPPHCRPSHFIRLKGFLCPFPCFVVASRLPVASEWTLVLAPGVSNNTDSRVFLEIELVRRVFQ
jgi:hypothetical protein